MSYKPTVLIIDDEKNILTSLSRMLDLEGYRPVVAGSASIGLEKIAADSIDCVLLDVRMPEMDGLKALSIIRDTHGDLPVIMMSGHASLETAVKATHAGANDFLEKPIGIDRLLVTLENALAFRSLLAENQDLKQRVSSASKLIGESPVMRQLSQSIAMAAPTRARVLVTGENGTGKELVALALHRGSDRKDAPFVKVNCAAIPAELIESELFGHEKGAFTGAHKQRKGKFELADGGTLFLDEIGDMRLDVQAKLLRVLQEGEVDRVGGSASIAVDVRVIAATNKDLPAEIEQGRFREDLYYRINVIPIQTPPLRDRAGDIPLLVEHFITESCKENGRRPKNLSASALESLQRHAWPGNVRELGNICERLVILTPGDTVSHQDVARLLPDFRTRSAGSYERGQTLKDMMAVVERELIVAALEDHEGHMTNTAQGLGLERSHLYKKLKALGIR